MADKGRRRTGSVVLWVVFALLLAGVGGMTAVLLNHRNEVDRMRAAQAAELEQAREDLDDRNAWLVDAETRRNSAQARYGLEASRAARDVACVAYIQGILNEMKKASSINVQYGRCVQTQ